MRIASLYFHGGKQTRPFPVSLLAEFGGLLTMVKSRQKFVLLTKVGAQTHSTIKHRVGRTLFPEDE